MRQTCQMLATMFAHNSTKVPVTTEQMNGWRSRKTIAFSLIFLNLCTITWANPIYMDHSFGQFQTGRNIRNLPCVVRKSGQSGVCMFAIDCIKRNGTHLGTCIDRFYFGSCCQLQNENTLSPEISENNIEQNTISHFVHEPTIVETTIANKVLQSESQYAGEAASTNVQKFINNVTNKYPTTSSQIKTTTTTLKPIVQNKVTTSSITTGDPTRKPLLTTSIKPVHLQKPVATTSERPILTSAAYRPEERIEITTLPTKFYTFQMVSTNNVTESFNNELPITTYAPISTTVSKPKPTKNKPYTHPLTNFTASTGRPGVMHVSTTKKYAKPIKHTTSSTPSKNNTNKLSVTEQLSEKSSTSRPMPTLEKWNTTKPLAHKPYKPASTFVTKSPSVHKAPTTESILNISTTYETKKKPPVSKPILTTTDAPSSTANLSSTNDLISRNITHESHPTSPAEDNLNFKATTPAPKPETTDTTKETLQITTTTTTKVPIRTTTLKTTTTTTTAKPSTSTKVQTTTSTTTTTSAPKTTTNTSKLPSTTKKPITTGAPTTKTTTKVPTTKPTTTKPPPPPSTTRKTTTTTTTRIPTKGTTKVPTTNKPITTTTPSPVFSSTVEIPIIKPITTIEKTTTAPVEVTTTPMSTTSTTTTLTTTTSTTTENPIGLVTWSNIEKEPETESNSELDNQSKPLPSDWVIVSTIAPDISNKISTEKPNIDTSKITTEKITAKLPETTSTTTIKSPVIEMLTSTNPVSTDPSTEIEMTTNPENLPSETSQPPVANEEYVTNMPVFSSFEGLSYKQICGRRMFPEPRIVGGSNAAFGRWPWQVSLRQWRTPTYLHKCGAALLNENWAITAAHCVDNVPPSDLLLRLGEYDLAEEEEPYGYQERRVQIVASHPQFHPRTFEYDLALLRFYEPVIFQPNIIPVCVPDSDDDFIGHTGFVTGWGRLYEDGPLPSVLQEVAVPIINNTICETMYRSAGYIEHIPHIFICAGWKKGGYDSCEGDSGGPMVLQRDEDKRFVLGGVISWGIGCAEANQPGVYTRISEFRDWINQILQF